MKLKDEVKVEHAGIVRAIHAENAQPVEYGQLLFELELADGRPPVLLGGPCSRACSSPTAGRSPCG